MADTVFIAGTVVRHEWLNDVNAITYNIQTTTGAGLVGFLQLGTGGVLRTVQNKIQDLVGSADFANLKGTDNWGYGTGVFAALAPAGAGTAVQSVAIGTNALAAMTIGFANVAIGHNAAKALTENCYTTAVGAYALEHANLVGNVSLLCTGIGAYALNANTTGQYNTAVGAQAGQFNTTGFFNTYVGKQAGMTNDVGTSNTALGHAALEFNIGSSNVAIGNKAMWNQTTSSSSVAIGDGAMSGGTGGLSQSIAIGVNALALASTGNHVAIGYRAGESTQTGTANVYVGWQAGLAVQGTGSRNTFIGHEAGTAMTSNTDSVSLGYRSFFAGITSQATAIGTNSLLATNGIGGTNCVALGYNAGASNTTGVNNIFLGASAGTDAVATVTTANNQLVLGNNSITNAFIKVALTVTSDARDKTDVIPLNHGLHFVKQLQPKAFKLKDRATGEATTGVRYGFLAQDVAALDQGVSELVNSNDADNLKMNEAMLIPILVKAIQELQAEIEELKKK